MINMITCRYDTISIIFDNKWSYLALHIIVIAGYICTYVAVAVYLASIIIS